MLSTLNSFIQVLHCSTRVLAPKRSKTQQKIENKVYFLISILKRKFRPFFPTSNFLLTCQNDTSASSMSDKVH